MLLRAIFPQPYVVEVTKLRQQLDEAHLAWAVEWKRQQLDYKIETSALPTIPIGTSGCSVCKPPMTAKACSGARCMSLRAGA